MTYIMAFVDLDHVCLWQGALLCKGSTWCSAEIHAPSDGKNQAEKLSECPTALFYA